MPDTQVEIPDVIKDLAAGISVASEAQNAYWLALAVAAVFVVLPQTTSAADKPTTYKMPFNLPDVGATWFAVIGVVLLSGLIVAFCAAWANLIESETVAREVLDECEPQRDDASKRRHRTANRYLAQQRKPSLTLVSSLWNPYDGPWRRRAYRLYKATVLGAWLGLPAVALGWAVWKYVHTKYEGPLGYAFIVVVWIAVPVAYLALGRATWMQFGFLRWRSDVSVVSEQVVKSHDVADLESFILHPVEKGGAPVGPAQVQTSGAEEPTEE
jgi:hypothetical protein